MAKTIHVSDETHKRLKVGAADKGVDLSAFTEAVLTSGLKVKPAAKKGRAKK